jgi:hypothetical protein
VKNVSALLIIIIALVLVVYGWHKNSDANLETYNTDYAARAERIDDDIFSRLPDKHTAKIYRARSVIRGDTINGTFAEGVGFVTKDDSGKAVIITDWHVANAMISL